MTGAIRVTWYWQQYPWYTLVAKINKYCAEIFFFKR